MIRKSFNRDWSFYKVDGSGEERVIGNITLPHDAMLLEKRDPNTKNSFNTGYFPGGVYHYSKNFFVSEVDRNKKVIFEFEGVYMNSEVYLNGNLAGGHPYGYSNFYITAENYLNIGKENKIEVVVHNENEPNSRWYTGSGIYRNVKILRGDPLHIIPDGIKITTLGIQHHRAIVEVATSIFNGSKENKAIHLVIEISSKDGVIAATGDVPVTINMEEKVITRQTFHIQHPALWSIDHPNLYACSTKILQGENLIDEGKETFGIRMLALDPKRGFLINNEVIKLRGACVHHDNGVIGACTLEAAEERRVRLLKESGFNAIRSAHNPMSKAMLDACDRHGMLVMDEFSDTWFRHKTKFDYALYFRDWWERDIQAMVDKDYNHPCVVMYSIGNEISEATTPEGVDYSRKLADKVRSLDRTRFVINNINGALSYFMNLGQHFNRKRGDNEKIKPRDVEGGINTSAFTNTLMSLLNKFMDKIVRFSGIDKSTKDAFTTVDIAGYNYMAGRYIKDGKSHPGRVMCGSETFPPEIAKNWRLVKELPYVIGDFSWTGWDYLGEAGLCTWQYGGNQAMVKPYPYLLADSPLIDITGHRGTQSYIHEIVWGLRKGPYITVQPVNHYGEQPSKSVWRGTNSIDSWTWNSYEGKGALVEVYADADQVELFLNGRSLGKKPAGQAHHFKAVYKTTYQPGELTARSYLKNGEEIGRMTLKTASHPLQLHVQSEVSSLKADGTDLAFINILLGDENEIIDPLADRLVTIQAEGAGSLLGFGSANPLTEERFTDYEHTTYFGRLLAVVRAGLNAGVVKITVSTHGCEPKVLTIPVDELTSG
jgi:beta-galactosidase